jgi:hypothetical protein
LYDRYIHSRRSETHVALQYRDQIHETILTRLQVASELTAGGKSAYAHGVPATVVAYDVGLMDMPGAQCEHDLTPWWVVHRQFMSGKIEDMLEAARRRECPLPLPQLCHTVLFLCVNKSNLVAAGRFAQLLDALRTLLRGYLDLIVLCECDVIVTPNHNELLSEFSRVCFQKDAYSVVRGFGSQVVSGVGLLDDLPPYNNDLLFKIAHNLRVDEDLRRHAFLCATMTQTCAMLDEYMSQPQQFNCSVVCAK